MAKIRPKELFDKVITSEVKTAFWVSWLAFVFVVGFTYIFFKYKGDFLRSVFVEAHGMLFDLFVIATFILWLNKKAEKKRNIQRWQEEIDDFRGWDEKEATFRIVGNIKRLNRNGITNINLADSFLKNVNFSRANLKDADLTWANLEEAYLGKAHLEGTCLLGANLRRAYLGRANLEKANLEGAKLFGANLEKANLNGANLEGANLEGAVLLRANLGGANLGGAKLEGANLEGADLRGANLMGADFRGADLRGADLRGAINVTIEQLLKVTTLFEAKLDPELMEQIKEKYPHLLEVPKEEEE